MEELTPTYPHPWCKRVAAYLPDALFIKPLSELDVRWRRVQQLLGQAPTDAAVEDAIQGCLTLLEHHTKDMRVLTALLHCLLERKTPDSFIVGLQLLATWMDCAWLRAHPMSTTQKALLLTTLLEEAACCAVLVRPLCHRAQYLQAVDAVEAVAQRLSLLLPERTALAGHLQQVFVAEPSRWPGPTLVTTTPSRMPALQTRSPQADGVASRESLLVLSQRLMCEAPDEPVGYLLRRHAMWSSLSVALHLGDEVALSAPSAQHIRTGMACLNAPSVAKWHDFERLLECAPYWFDGQRLSAAIAMTLGYIRVSDAVHQATLACLRTHPQLRALTFDDGSPLISSRTDSWLTQSAPAFPQPSIHSDLHEAEVARRGSAQLVTGTLTREDVQLMMQQAEEWRLAGRDQEASQRYRWLLHHARQRGVASWEPRLLEQLSECLIACTAKDDTSTF